MSAILILHQKEYFQDGSLIEMIIWQVPRPVPPTTHGYKYRCVYVKAGRRIVGFDNERGKGDHMHLEDEQWPYAFSGVPQLVEDFLAEVDKRRLP